jgi:Uma2 family endonuclease
MKGDIPFANRGDPVYGLGHEEERNMIVMTSEPEAPDDSALQYFLSLDTPEGYRAELIDGEIVVTPPPNGNHEHCTSRIIAQVFANSVTLMDVAGHKGLVVPAAATGKSHLIPDLTFARRDLNLFRGAPSWMSPGGVALVVEVTSSSPDHDRIGKRHGYAAATIPLYLLVDRQQGQVTLFSDPARGDYATKSQVPFGDTVKLPAPFSFTLETEDFAA